MAFKIKSRLSKWDNHVAFHGNTLNTFYRPPSKATKGKKEQKSKYKGKIECWLKVLIIIVSFFMSIKNDGLKRNYFVSTSAIHKSLLNYGCTYNIRTVQRAINKLIKWELISKEAYPATPEELKLNPKNHHLRRRKLVPNMDLIKLYLNVYDEEDLLITSLPKKHPLRKLMYKRPYSYVEKITEKFNEYTDNGNRSKPYKDENEMFAYWVIKYSSKYFDTSKMIEKFIPESLDNRQERANEAAISKASSKGVLTFEELQYYVNNIDMMFDEEKHHIVGYKVPNELRNQVIKLGYQINKNGFISGFLNIYRTQGFESIDDDQLLTNQANTSRYKAPEVESL